MPREMAYVRERCMECRFYWNLPGKGIVCRRFPPDRDGRHPPITEAGWCGEWREQRQDQPTMFEGEAIEHKPGRGVSLYRR